MTDGNVTRRRVLAGVASLATVPTSGCLGIFFGGDDNAPPPENLLEDGRDTHVRTHPDLAGAINSVRHVPTENTTTVEAVIEVPEEMEYEVRLGVVDEDEVTLAYEKWTETYYPTGKNRAVKEFSIEDCGRCYSGLLEVDLTDEEKERRQEATAQQRRAQRKSDPTEPSGQSNDNAGGNVGGNAGGNRSEAKRPPSDEKAPESDPSPARENESADGGSN